VQILKKIIPNLEKVEYFTDVQPDIEKPFTISVNMRQILSS